MGAGFTEYERLTMFYSYQRVRGLLAAVAAIESARVASAAQCTVPSTLIDFTSPVSASDWQARDDRVMGGTSLSQVVFRDGSTFFEGDLVVRGGGFASVRCMRPLYLPPDAVALSLRAKSDGRLGYKLTLQSAAGPQGVSYQAALPLTTPGRVEDCRLPLDAFRPTFRGRALPEAPPLRAADVRGVGLMLSRYEAEGGGGAKMAIPPGPFSLELRRLGVADE